MKIFFNQHYSSSPYLDLRAEDCFGTVYCGCEELLAVMMLHGGIVRSEVSPEERKAIYHNNMQRRIKASDPFWQSFRLDSFATSNAVLMWRDTLVEAGWDMRSGTTPKLRFIRDMEPENLPTSNADYWNKVLSLSATRLLFPENTEITVTQRHDSIEPKIAGMLANQEKLGLSVRFLPDTKAIANGNLGKIQQWILNGRKGRIKLGAADDTLELLRFDNEDSAMRYVAKQPAERWALYHCQQPKLFDNILHLLGQPMCGSQLDGGEPQVVQLFMLGNGMFENPLNLNRILAWLNAPIHPLRRALCRRLAKALASSGGVFNDEWNATIENYLNSFDNEKDRKEESDNIATFLPFRRRPMLDIESIISFNEALRKWAIGRLAMEDFPYEDIVREQLRQIATDCNALLNILREQPQENISFVKLQRWCRSIVTAKSYTQYEAREGCRSIITAEGNMHSAAESLVWFCIEDGGTDEYPFDFLTSDEFAELNDRGAYLCSKKQYSYIRGEAKIQTLLRTRRLTIVECAKIGGEPLHRHPLMLQLNEAVENGLSSLFCEPQLAAEALTEDWPVDNISDTAVLQLEPDIVLRPRHEQKSAESYSSLDLLIQHPFDYVCQYNAALGDVGAPTMDDLNRTMGNVAHRIIEKVFGKGSDKAEQGRRIRDEYDNIFDEAVDSVGLLLRQHEYAIEINYMHKQMKEALQRIQKIIIDNNLTVDECEYEFRTAEWVEAGDGVQLASRADILLTDDCGGKVIFDFKWSYSRKSYERRVQSNSALQLAIYKYLAEREFGRQVRTAYILLPSAELISADNFDGFNHVRQDTSDDIMQQAANAYAFRRRQLADGRIERAEGRMQTDSEYGAEQENRKLYPLKEYGGVVSENIYSKFGKLR